MNKKWILNYAGEQKCKFIKNKSIICLGSLLGTLDKFLEFSKTLYKNLKENLKDIDQGNTNYMIFYENFLNDYLIKSDNSGFMITIWNTKNEKISYYSENNILNFNG